MYMHIVLRSLYFDYMHMEKTLPTEVHTSGTPVITHMQARRSVRPLGVGSAHALARELCKMPEWIACWNGSCSASKGRIMACNTEYSI